DSRKKVGLVTPRGHAALRSGDASRVVAYDHQTQALCYFRVLAQGLRGDELRDHLFRNRFGPFSQRAFGHALAIASCFFR
ncbi:hypothetical protein ABTB07_23155, partial [Acinetobacter baumannii]